MTVDTTELGMLCEALPLLREAAAEWTRYNGESEDVMSRLDNLVRDVRLGVPITDRFRSLAGLLGVPLSTRPRGPRRGAPRLSVILPQHTVPQIFLCPSGTCDRRWVRRPDKAIAYCTFDGIPLKEAEAT
jgi:hypothetical protein